MKIVRLVVILAVVLAVAGAFYGCKKKEEPKPTAATAPTAGTAVTIVCPKPGEDLICKQHSTLFTEPKDYAAHMEKEHPADWAKIKDEFTKNFNLTAPATATKK
jgi:hypothetical protein